MAAPPITMKIFSLNCCGLGNPETVGELHNMVRKEDPKIVFLMETRLPFRKLELLRVRLGMQGRFGVARQGYGGGLALLWDSRVTLNIESYSQHHIDAKVIQEDGLQWRLTGFYGHPEVALRPRSWELLRRLHDGNEEPWMVVGDFNEITSLDEKSGMADRSLPQMAAFRGALSDCSLHDLGYHGPDFTWSNRRGPGTLVRVRLDRSVANPAWSNLFPNSHVDNVIISNSDHMGVLVDLAPSLVGPQHRHKLFRFEHS